MDAWLVGACVWILEQHPVEASGYDPPVASFMGPDGVEARSHPPAGWGSGLAVQFSGGDWHPEGGGSQDMEASGRYPWREPGESPGDISKGKGKAQGVITLVFKMSVTWTWYGFYESPVRDPRKPQRAMVTKRQIWIHCVKCAHFCDIHR